MPIFKYQQPDLEIYIKEEYKLALNFFEDLNEEDSHLIGLLVNSELTLPSFMKFEEDILYIEPLYFEDEGTY